MMSCCTITYHRETHTTHRWNPPYRIEPPFNFCPSSWLINGFVTRVTRRVCMWSRNSLPFLSCVHLVFSLVLLGFVFFILSNYMSSSFPCWDIRYDIRVNTIFDSSLLPFVLLDVQVLFMLFVVIYDAGVQHDFHIRWCSCRLTVTRRVSKVE